jgi:hypothetical protein
MISNLDARRGDKSLAPAGTRTTNPRQSQTRPHPILYYSGSLLTLNFKSLSQFRILINNVVASSCSLGLGTNVTYIFMYIMITVSLRALSSLKVSYICVIRLSVLRRVVCGA